MENASTGTIARAPQATVAGDSDASPETYAAAEAIGRMLARMGVTVVTGGRGGVMEAASRGARMAGGLAIGIMPGTAHRESNPWLTVALPTGMEHARNVLTALAGDFLIALGGGAGTLSEVCFAWIHGRPILTLAGHGSSIDRIAGAALDGRRSSTVVRCATIEELETAVRETCRRLGLAVRDPSAG